MDLPLIWLVVLLGFGLSRVAELRIHRAHYAVLINAGAEERSPGLMRAYYALSLALPLVALLEQVYFIWPVARETMVGGLILIGLALGLRYWAMQSLGIFWTMRCVRLADARDTNSGPYRYIDHPEYVSRIVEGVGLGLVLGGRYATAGIVIALLLMTLRLVVVEREQLASQPAFK